MIRSLRRAALLAACGLLGFTAPLPGAHAADNQRVIVGFTYVIGDTLGKGGAPAVGPADTIAAGDSVTYTNLDPVAHTVTSTTGAFDTGDILMGASATISGLAPGTYPFYCRLHGPGLMSGTLVVQ